MDKAESGEQVFSFEVEGGFRGLPLFFFGGGSDGSVSVVDEQGTESRVWRFGGRPLFLLLRGGSASARVEVDVSAARLGGRSGGGTGVISGG